MLNATYVLNQELNGVEIYFNDKPVTDILSHLKANGFRWNGKKICWYAKQNEKTLQLADELTKGNVTAATTESKTTTNKKVNQVLSLYDRLQFIQGSTDTSKYKYRFVGSNYTGLSTKDTAKEIRQHLKKQFPEVKFSVTSSYSKIDVTIKSSPYTYKKLAYSPELINRQYRDYEEEHNKEINAIFKYCQQLLNSYNYDDSDTMTDYFHTHFYDSVSIDYDYQQTEQTEQIKADIESYRSRLLEDEKAEQERLEMEYQELEKQREIEHQEHLQRLEEEKRQEEIINNNAHVTELPEDQQYFIIGSKFADLNKNCTLAEYQEEIAKGKYSLEDVKIEKEIHFTDRTALDYFSNLLLHDFSFLINTGGSYTDDARINSMTDYDNMDKEERSTVKWLLKGVAIYYNNELQFIVDAQGYSYARYVGLVDDVTVTKDYTFIQVVTDEEIQLANEKADTVTDISTEVITANNMLDTWNSERWTDYKNLMKDQLKAYSIKLTKPIVQQINEELEELKVAMYRILREVDGVQEQFKEADLQQGQKITLIGMSDFGGVTTSYVTVDSVENTTYAQYDDAVKLIFKQPNKRGLFYKHLYKDMLIYDGWLEVPKNILYDIEQSNGFIVTKTKYGSCDKKQYDAIIDYLLAQGNKPIINTYKPIF